MATVDDVAQWMKSELENTNWLYQETVVYKIKELFGDTFVYLNANGNLSIDKKVLGRVRISTLRNENETFSQLNSITYIGVFLRLVTYSHLP